MPTHSSRFKGTSPGASRPTVPGVFSHIIGRFGTRKHGEQPQGASEVFNKGGGEAALAIHERRNRSGNAETIRPGFFPNARDCTLHNTVMNLNYYDHEHAMKSLEAHAMRGAEFDSSDRSPPPRCHPGTRKSIVEQTQRWLHDTERQKKIFWFFGTAGGGKSAIMQTIAEWAAESPDIVLGATLFFSRPNGRNDPQKVFITLACQIAVAYPPYRGFVVQEIASNPRLPLKSIKTQFARLIVEPFVRRGIYQGSNDLLILLDGLDECEGERAQCEIVELVSSFSLSHPNAPLTWIIASRPESHLQAAFLRKGALASYEKEEVPIDSDEACVDVENYLREEFERIQHDDPILRLQPYWPMEGEFLTITAAAGGLFAFASTAIKFIDDPTYGNPVSGLALLLGAINKALLQPSKGRSHPLARLDALYAFILSAIPSAILPDAKLLLTNHLVLGNVPFDIENKDDSLAFLCNWVGLSSHDAYSALRRLHSVLTIPSPEEAETEKLSFHHQSFYEYLRDPERSQTFHISDADLESQEVECSLRILKEAHLGVTSEDNEALNTSDVILSWSTSDSANVQKALYERAAWSISGVVDRYDPSLIVLKLQDPDVVHVMKTLNLVEPRTKANGNSYLNVEFLYCIQHKIHPQIRREFERLKLLRTARLGNISLEDVEDAQMFARCGTDVHGELRWTTTGAPLHGPYIYEYYTDYRRVWRSDDENADGHREQILDGLRYAIAETPDVPVLLFGNATRTYLLYEFKTSNDSELWTYYVPYRVPPGLSIGPS